MWTGTYVINWQGNVSLAQMPACYNLIFMFVGLFQNNQLTFDSPTSNADYQAAIAQGRRIVLSIGGANNHFDFPNRAVSDKFIADFQAINARLGNPFSGLDFDNNEGSTPITTSEYIYICQRLQQIYGQRFLITYPAASWDGTNLNLARALVNAGIPNFYAGPQWYDGPGLNDAGNVMSQFTNWANVVGQERMMIGFGIRNSANYWTGATAAACLRQVLARFPRMAGIYDWEYVYDRSVGNPFANQVAPILGQLSGQSSAPAPAPVTTPAPSPAPVAVPAPDATWNFIQGQDSWDGQSHDQQLDGYTVQQLKDYCKNHPEIVAFNTNGFIKTTASTPKAEPTFTGASQGLYVRRVTVPVVVQPVVTPAPVVVQPSSIPVQDWVISAQSSSGFVISSASSKLDININIQRK